MDGLDGAETAPVDHGPASVEVVEHLLRLLVRLLFGVVTRGGDVLGVEVLFEAGALAVLAAAPRAVHEDREPELCHGRPANRSSCSVRTGAAGTDECGRWQTQVQISRHGRPASHTHATSLFVP